jgi:hypothetical protein
MAASTAMPTAMGANWPQEFAQLLFHILCLLLILFVIENTKLKSQFEF